MDTYAEIQEKRALFAMRLGTARPDHAWVATNGGCGRCPVQSPFRWEPGSHLYMIEEEPT